LTRILFSSGAALSGFGSLPRSDPASPIRNSCNASRFVDVVKPTFHSLVHTMRLPGLPLRARRSRSRACRGFPMTESSSLSYDRCTSIRSRPQFKFDPHMSWGSISTSYGICWSLFRFSGALRSFRP
jgi:hypothetical protein